MKIEIGKQFFVFLNNLEMDLLCFEKSTLQMYEEKKCSLFKGHISSPAK